MIGLLSSGYGGRIGAIGSRSKWQAFEAAAPEQGTFCRSRRGDVRSVSTSVQNPLRRSPSLSPLGSSHGGLGPNLQRLRGGTSDLLSESCAHDSRPAQRRSLECHRGLGAPLVS